MKIIMEISCNVSVKILKTIQSNEYIYVGLKSNFMTNHHLAKSAYQKQLISEWDFSSSVNEKIALPVKLKVGLFHLFHK